MKIIYFKYLPNGESHSFYFKVQSNGNVYNQRIQVSEREILDWSCTCIFGSTFRFSEKNMAEDTRCKHSRECINLLVCLGYLN